MRGKVKHGMNGPRLYRIWDNMRGRVTRPSNTYFHNYGGRGVTLCEAWKSFIPFMEWALANGYRDDLTLERVDNDGPYSPENCRWATRREQDRNKRQNVWVNYNGERICQQDLARRLGVHYTTIRYRLKTGKLEYWKD
jgi:hypothetical protein